MFSKLAMTVLVAFAGLNIVTAGPAPAEITPTCPNGAGIYCCTFTKRLSSEDTWLINN